MFEASSPLAAAFQHQHEVSGEKGEHHFCSHATWADAVRFAMQDGVRERVDALVREDDGRVVVLVWTPWEVNV